jgi:hypothetical protein
MFRFAAVAALVFAASCGVGQSEITEGDDSVATTDQEVRKNDPCAVVRCAAGTHCVSKGRTASCVADPSSNACTTDADCRLFDNYCDGCSCQALSSSQPAPVCNGTYVACFVQPCSGRTAVCSSGTCQLAP